MLKRDAFLIGATVLLLMLWVAPPAISQFTPQPVTVDSGTITLSSNVIDTELNSAATLANDMSMPSTSLIGAVCMEGSDGDVDFCIPKVTGPCATEQPIWVSVSQTADTQYVTGTASERIYICQIWLNSAAAENYSPVSGTGTTCGTSTADIPGLGGAGTAATGFQGAAKGGFVLPFNEYAWGETDTDADNVCILQSGSGQITGGFSYVSL